jgi:hypothetical protein
MSLDNHETSLCQDTLNALCRRADEIDRELLVQTVQARSYGLLLLQNKASVGFKRKNLQNQDPMKLESEPKGPSCFRSAKVKVIMLNKIVQLKIFEPFRDD